MSNETETNFSKGKLCNALIERLILIELTLSMIALYSILISFFEVTIIYLKLFI